MNPDVTQGVTEVHDLAVMLGIVVVYLVTVTFLLVKWAERKRRNG